ncbi:3'(2'),5'-bisphosphate nucleotidase CysQ [Oricola cellulosilytica]|uniref:3'(2'),5'-bisphosphate nucleotidase CysQ n=2 Tax=Oricola cellulosilytica TaxID=1429082 RepID=A0A4R0PKH0_9HYPH|nr:3'(2'),5'-bisphosphate nucleotidase CysQ [Oricola cellulosilytica]
MRYFRGDRAMDVQWKNGSSPVSAGDFAVDRFLREKLTLARPGYGWLSEETTDERPETRQSASRTFVVDPIDGTRAYIDGRDTWCISVAIVENGVSIAGVLECPALGLRYDAVAGGGSRRNGEPLRMKPVAEKPLIAAPRAILAEIDAAYPGGYRQHPHVPSLAYRLALIADGSIDATVVKPKAHDWDIAAAGLLISEAGGILRALDGQPLVLNARNVVKPALVAGRAEVVAPMFGVVTEDTFG